MAKTLEELRLQYYGNEDKSMETLVSVEPTYKRVYETKTITQPHNHFYDIPKLDLPNIGYANFKLLSPVSNVLYIELEIGGRLIERPMLYKFLNNEAKFYLMSENRCIPHLENQTIRIFFITHNKEDIAFSYDVVEVSNKSDTYNYLCNLEQFTGTEELKGLRQEHLENGNIKLSCHLYFNLLINSIYAFLPEDATDVRLILDKVDHNLLFTKEDNYYIFDFGNTLLNFSNIDIPSVSFVCKNINDDSLCTVVAITSNIVSILNGKLKLALR
jgi:hypothetical protein